MAVDLFGIFDGLRPPENASGLRFAAVPIPGFEMHRIGKDAESNASLLISSSPTDEVVTAPIVLEHLSIQYDVECTITHPDGRMEIGDFSLIRCTDLDPALERYFLRIAGALVAELGPSPRRSDVAIAVGRLVALFRAIQGAPRQTAQGLWAELLVIAGARSPEKLVAAWHVLPDDLYDFSAAAERIEVKSASGRIRRHRFAFDQLEQASPARVLIASILVERAGAGVSLAELVSEIRQGVQGHADLLLRIDEVVITTLGNNWRRSLSERFDRDFAERSLSFYNVGDIPTVRTPLPPQVTDVHFVADLTGRPTVDIGRFRRDSDLFSAASRR